MRRSRRPYNAHVDDHTLEKLEFDLIRRILAKHASCALGKELAGRITPSRKATQVSLWRTQAMEFNAWSDAHGLPPLGGIRDVRGHIRRAVPPAKLEPEEFADVASTLEAIVALRRYLTKEGEPNATIAKLAGRVGDFQPIVERIRKVIDDRGMVVDHASDRLWRIRQEIDKARMQIREVFDRILRQPHITRYLQYPNATFHADRMVLPLRADQRGRVNGIVHRSSDSGQTLFVEPAEAVELNNTRINLIQSESEEVGRILWELTHLIHLNQKELLRTLETVALIDLLTAKIRFARKYNLTIPEHAEQPKLLLRRARNPILLTQGDDGNGDGKPTEVVPIDVRLGDDFDVMVITGPNTGGKTAALKTVGLIAVMAQAGLPVPAEAGSTLPTFEGIWIDVGDEQSLHQSLSTFSAHLRRILDIVHRARPRTLVLLDELGAGTDPDEGAAIGRAIVEHLVSSKCLAMVTTHLGSLKAMALDAPRVDNASVQFDIETLRPTFELRIGEPGLSNAIAIASRLGMPRALVEKARRHLTSQHRALNKAIGQTLKSRRQAERAWKDAEQARAEAARATLAALDQAKALEKEQLRYSKWLDRVLKLRPGDPVRVAKFDNPGRIVRIRLEKQEASVDLGTLQVEVPLSELTFEL